MRVAVTGAQGQLGGEFLRQLGEAATGLSRADLDLSLLDAIEPTIAGLRPNVLIHCAAYTQVDRAEKEPDLCLRINALAVERLAHACREIGCLLAYISSDYVFGADLARRTPYSEGDPVGPQGVYARSKEGGEQAARQAPEHLIIRTCGLYSRSPGGPIKGRNFVETMLCLAQERPTLRVVCDQFCTPSYAPHVAGAVLKLIGEGGRGTYHVVNSGHTTWYGFATELFRQAGVSIGVDPISAADYGAPAPRPDFSVLSDAKLCGDLGYSLPTWQAGLAEYLGRSAPAAAELVE